ncbi:hypothetical protein QTO34_018901 [Cnephaeus nilssonii]|uniref:Uncharacterized protein n=1 Tax=Cnephaeus nilssonii TaxID=3371016 RepID=A0AA40LQI9_CNENI|nr:hypothetical protein QTO34_018901 [Eptesicus nilssonii]
MPLAQLKEPWPLMELVPLDPEIVEKRVEKLFDLVKIIPGEGEDLGACYPLVPPPMGRAPGPLDSLASASLASPRSSSCPALSMQEASSSCAL